MARIALTGGIACGKSLVARFLNEFGVATIDADDIVHRLVPAEARLAAQLPVEEKAARSHYVIENDGSVEELKEKANEFVEWLKARIGRQ